MAQATCVDGEEDVRSKSAQNCECQSESKADSATEVDLVGMRGSVSLELEELGFICVALVYLYFDLNLGF